MIRAALIAALLVASQAANADDSMTGAVVKMRSVMIDGDGEFVETRFGKMHTHALMVRARGSLEPGIAISCNNGSRDLIVGIMLPKLSQPGGELEIQLDAGPVHASRRIGSEASRGSKAGLPAEISARLLTASTLSVARDGYIYTLPLANHRLLLRQLFDVCRP